MSVLDAVSPDLYSLAQSDVDGRAETGEPNTLVWAYASPTAELSSATTTSQEATTRTADECNQTLPTWTQQEPTRQ